MKNFYGLNRTLFESKKKVIDEITRRPDSILSRFLLK